MVCERRDCQYVRQGVELEGHRGPLAGAQLPWGDAAMLVSDLPKDASSLVESCTIAFYVFCTSFLRFLSLEFTNSGVYRSLRLRTSFLIILVHWSER